MQRGLIGMIHLGPVPGDSRASADTTFDGTQDTALRDAEALCRGGADALLIENFGSAPWPRGTAGDRLPAHQLAFIARVARACIERFDRPVGVNCLRNDALGAVGIAAATGAAFVRVNVHTGAYVTDQGIIQGEAHRTLSYRRTLGAGGVSLLADVLVKHATPLAPISATQTTRDTLERGMADGVIVTGDATGGAIALERLREVREAAGDAPVYAGSGVTAETAAAIGPWVDGAIVGTALKEGGRVDAPVDTDRVRRVGDALRACLRGT